MATGDVLEYRQIHLKAIGVDEAVRLLAPQLGTEGYAQLAGTGSGSLKEFPFYQTDPDGVPLHVTVMDGGLEGLDGVLINESHVANGRELLFARISAFGKNPLSDRSKTIAGGSKKFLDE
jgi:hypothetical protein